MKLFEFYLTDAAMNPKAFQAAIKTGQQQGVLVGFEFEVCIPQKSIKALSIKEPEKKHTAQEVINIIYTSDVLDEWETSNLSPAKFDAIFKVKPGADVRYPSMVETEKQVQKTNLAKIKELFDQVPPKERAKTIRHIRDNYPGALVPGKEFRFAYLFGLRLYYDYRGKTEELGHRIKTLATVDMYTTLLPEMLGFNRIFTNQALFNKFAEVFEFDPDVVYKKLNLSYYEDDEDDDDDYPGYSEGAKLLKPYVEQAMGANVIVYKEYHQATKNLTDWYIEPDGSLEANGNDSAAEVVSPPLPAEKAMADLEKFYAMAKQLGLYTDARNNTGIHINVSIPKDIDVLKLAMFLGDQHVLKAFGREDNYYAQSVIKSLQGSDKLQNTKFDLSLLQQVAQRVTNNHYASISQGGKYISFRHAGGDYLNQYQEIANTVGRFINAMIIASDPAAYKDEYLKKLAATFKFTPASQFPSKYSANVPQSDRVLLYRSMFNTLRQQGLPIHTFNVMVTARLSRANTILNYIDEDSNYTVGERIVSTIPQSQAAKQDLISKVRNPSLKQRIEATDAMAFTTIVAAPEGLHQVRGMLRHTLPGGVNAIKNMDEKVIGYYTVTRSYLPPTDPATVLELKDIAREYKYEVKRERQAARSRATRARNKANKATTA